MAVRTLYLARHGKADALGNLVPLGREQCVLLARRLSSVPLDAIWHSPLPRAAESARIIAASFPGVFLDAASELIDHVPYVPPPAERQPSSVGFFDGTEHARRSRHLFAESLTMALYVTISLLAALLTAVTT